MEKSSAPVPTPIDKRDNGTPCPLSLFCVIIPTYNNERTLLDIVDRSLAVCPNVIVVNDGSTDATAQLLAQKANITIVGYTPNRGKGYALKQGLRHAREKGFRYAVTIDSDGQHQPEEISRLIAVARQHAAEKILVVGSRNLHADGMPQQNTFANRFSNFWFTLQTAQRLPDTQTGFRLYQLDALPSLSLITNRYESELEMLVFSAWRGVRLLAEPITVYYPPKEERVSHFRPGADFARISLLNTFLCLAALCYGYPSILFHKISHKR